MKILGARGNQLFLKRYQQADNQRSTSYADQSQLTGDIQVKIIRLKKSLNTEITIASPYIITLEELSYRYYEDAIRADKDNNKPFCITYRVAYERAVNIAINFYNCLPIVF